MQAVELRGRTFFLRYVYSFSGHGGGVNAAVQRGVSTRAVFQIAFGFPVIIGVKDGRVEELVFYVR